MPLKGNVGIKKGGSESTSLTVTAVKIVDYSANAGEFVPCNISSSGFTVTLPEAPANGTVIEIKITAVDSVAVLEIKAQGDDVFNKVGGETSIYLNLLSTVGVFTYASSTGIWYADISTPGSAFAAGFPGIDAQTPITNEDISINPTSRVLTIIPPLGYFYIHIDGNGKNTRIRKTGNVVFPAFTDDSGMWYFYFNSSGTAVTTRTPWTVDNFSTIVTVYRLVWNAKLYSFNVTSANATVGATYTNNSITYTVLATMAGGTILKLSGVGDPTADGDLVKASGTGGATIAFSTFNSNDKLVRQLVEYHLNDISADVHQWFHLAGTQWISGFSMANNAITTGTGNADGRNAVIALTTGKNVDDNLEYSVTNSMDGFAWTQDMGNTTPASLNATTGGLFRIVSANSLGELSYLPASRFPFDWNTSTNKPNYITALGVRTPVNNDYFFVYFVYAIQDPTAGRAVTLVSATTDFTTISLARAYTWTDIQTQLAYANDTEIRPLYRLIFENKGLVGAKYSVLRETQDIRKAQITSTTVASGSIPATSVTFVPFSTTTSTNVQNAIDELTTDKLNVSDAYKPFEPALAMMFDFQYSTPPFSFSCTIKAARMVVGSNGKVEISNGADVSISESDIYATIATKYITGDILKFTYTGSDQDLVGYDFSACSNIQYIGVSGYFPSLSIVGLANLKSLTVTSANNFTSLTIGGNTKLTTINMTSGNINPTSVLSSLPDRSTELFGTFYCVWTDWGSLSWQNQVAMIASFAAVGWSLTVSSS